MQHRADLLSKIKQAEMANFDETALAVFRWQAEHNPLYAKFLELLGRRPETVNRVGDIPFLPIQFFKTETVKTGRWLPQTEFSSSGTTGQTASRHHVRDLDFYLENARRGFARFYGDSSEWCVLALLPSYLERGGSSLVAMADDFIRRSKHPASGFFLHDFERLADTLNHCQSVGCPTLLLGVSFALLDFAERFPMDLRGITVMETGGMKGRRREMTRAELHDVLCRAFRIPAIHSEYGMTELFSQAYSVGGDPSVFRPAPTMRVLAMEVNDPFCPAAPGRTGVLNIVDLANLDSCAFVATEDVGRVHADGGFEVLGRLDAAEMRGCNLMVE